MKVLSPFIKKGWFALNPIFLCHSKGKFFCCLVKFTTILLLIKNGWMDNLQFFILFSSISVISGRYVGDNERLFAVIICH